MALPRALGELTRDEFGALRGYLVRYARSALHSADEAEDIVQQTLLAALEAQAGFQGHSTLRTWLTAILKHKITDHRRREARNPIVDVARRQETEGDPDELLETLYTAGSGGAMPAQPWADPIKTLENRRFWEAIEAGLRQLQPAGARAFWLSEFQGIHTDGICEELGISAGNCWVMLHRARLGLRSALAHRGFARPQ